MSEKKSDTEVRLPKKSLTIEFWVGVFAIIGLLCFSYLAINIGGMRLGNSGYYEIMAEFDSISGLKVGAPVEIAGVEVGDVSRIDLKATVALVTLRIRDNVQVRDDDIAAIRTKGIIGDRFVKIVPGGSEELLQAGSEIVDTESAVEFEEVLGKFIHTLE